MPKRRIFLTKNQIVSARPHRNGYKIGTPQELGSTVAFGALRGLDLNQRPLGYEPNELPGCSTPHSDNSSHGMQGQIAHITKALQAHCDSFVDVFAAARRRHCISASAVKGFSRNIMSPQLDAFFRIASSV